LPSFLQTLRDIGKSLRGYGINANELANMKNDKALGLESFLAQTIVKNQSSFETIIWYFLPQITKDEKILVKNLIPYDSEKPDLLKRLFEESYLGEKLFSEFYGLPAIFNFDRSFLEKEEFIPTKETLDALRIRSDKFAIYSEKPRFQGMALLNKSKFKDYFNEKQCFFQEDLTESGGSRLGKPNPTFFTELIENIFVKNHKVAYVGDGVADILLVRNARAKGYLNLLFFGVLCSSQHPSNLFSQYIKFEADAIMTDVNDLPYLFGKMDVIMK
jgi:phosphoglycolate phosphatase-like HAD superfamily hydrolase